MFLAVPAVDGGTKKVDFEGKDKAPMNRQVKQFVKTYIQEIGSGLVEFMAIGTAIKKIPGMATQSQSLPVHAMVSEKDTWIEGDFGFSLERAK